MVITTFIPLNLELVNHLIHVEHKRLVKVYTCRYTEILHGMMEFDTISNEHTYRALCFKETNRSMHTRLFKTKVFYDSDTDTYYLNCFKEPILRLCVVEGFSVPDKLYESATSTIIEEK